MSIIVTRASGQFGRLVTELLLERVPPSELILVTRKPAALAQLAARGVQVRRGSFDEPETLAAAFSGGERMLLISAARVGQRLEQHLRALDAAVAAGVRHIVYTSSVGIDARNPAIVIPDHLRTEHVLKGAGIAVTILRDSRHAELIATLAGPRALTTGRWLASAAEGEIAFVSKHDCAAAAAIVMTAEGHGGATYEITGPALLSFRDAARLVAEIGGRPIEYQVVSDLQMQAVFAAAGVPESYIEDLVSYERGIREGWFARCTDDLRRLIGRPARSLREVLLANRDTLHAARLQA